MRPESATGAAALACGLVALVWAAGAGGTAAASAPGDSPLERGDVAWSQRHRGAGDGGPAPGPIEAAIAAYDEALAREPGGLEARWKLLRALHFAGEFVAGDEAASRRRFERATDVAEEGMRRLARRTGDGVRLDELAPDEAERRIARSGLDRRDVARLHFWAAIDWGAWSRSVGLLEAVREGVAGRLHRYTRLAIELEPGYEEGGPLRLLGRLHAELPRVPFLTGWVDRDRALPLVTRAYEMAPENPGNRLLLALTLLDLAPERRDQALELLRDVARLEPRPPMRAEDLEMKREARERLEQERQGATS